MEQPIPLSRGEAYRTQLLDDCIPFWMKHGLDTTYGGFMTGLDRTGKIIESDKSVWFQGRAGWTMANAYLAGGRKDAALLQAAESCITFSDRHCFDSDGRMLFRVTRDGRKLIKRRYSFSEFFSVIARSSLAIAKNDPALLDDAYRLFRSTLNYLRDPNRGNPKVDPATRSSLGLAQPMIEINVAQELREAFLILGSDTSEEIEFCTRLIRENISIIQTNFVRPEFEAVVEQCNADGSLQDEHFEGRLINPGHSIEAAWFILREADYLKSGHGGMHFAPASPGSGAQGTDQAADTATDKGAAGRAETKPKDSSPPQADMLIELGVRILNWMWNIGWDEKHGGLCYFADLHGHPPFEYWHNMKFWWPHNEASIALLYAFLLTGDPLHAQRFHMLDSWIDTRFPDREHGEWFGYLNFDGSISTDLKGNMFKGPFHIPRMQMWGWNLIRRLHHTE
ncbi:AGE family epimerase/isomerase [Salinispira pacifica]|uniref:N-acylglucosamine 2-epimerase n=1 Tax=Salinispira pacifica TaxID=1307761 RepID=V5WFK3_9SPIO|nr:AGE family epimerase/isomerase [Salinispira pacifica]AHC13956.1 N-acylglucosamine 2-epimerase [Salinispira pacifica]